MTIMTHPSPALKKLILNEDILKEFIELDSCQSHRDLIAKRHVSYSALSNEFVKLA